MSEAQHHHHHPTVEQRLERIQDTLDSLICLGEKTVALVDDLKTGIAALDAETTRVGQRIDALVARLAQGTLSDAEKVEVMTALTAEADRLKVLGTDPNAPVPPPSPSLAAARKK